MISEREKYIRAGDTVLLACAIGQMLVTWATLAHGEGVPIWKPIVSVAVTMLLTLAALTPHELRAAALRRITAGWLLAAPWVLAFYEIAVARWFYLISGTLIASLSLMTFTTAPAEKHRAGAEMPWKSNVGPVRAAFGRMS